jgi:hypothetical protein
LKRAGFFLHIDFTGNLYRQFRSDRNNTSPIENPAAPGFFGKRFFNIAERRACRPPLPFVAFQISLY